MAGVNVTPGSGATMAADQIGTAAAPTSGQYLVYHKLDGGIAGASAPIEAGNAAALAAQVSTKALLTTHPGQWAETHAPAVNTQATKSHSAGAAGVRHVCNWLSITLGGDSTGSVQTALTFNLRDGATGAGTILASFTLSCEATAGVCKVLTLSGLNIVGTAATAMTLESASAPSTHNYASVAFGGFSTPNA